ncbi:MAG TPA: hypothetical protein VEC59_08730 [Steroidobacteraceae bacterium]|nr:hypothetical protein [Steroidobacteraceae bacterium]
MTRKTAAALLLISVALSATPPAQAAQSTAARPAQADCGALNTLSGEGKFTGQISTTPDGSTLQVTYGNQTVVVHYVGSVLVCQGGQPASVDALVRGASVSVFGPMRRNGATTEIDAVRIFVAGPPRTARLAPPAAAGAAPAVQATASPGAITQSAPPASPAVSAAAVRSAAGPAQRAIPESVILRASYPETMQRLRVVRKYALADVRGRPQVTVGEARVDFTPMLQNDKALFNVAQRLRALPQHVEVKEDSSEISEVDEGLVIHHTLTYRILPGKCADAGAKAQLARAGAGCFERASTTQRISEFSRPGSPRYVADPGKRQAAIAAYQRNISASTADANQGIASLRQALADPARRAAISARVGAAEAARLSGLSDDQLKEELINSAVQHHEETLFVPKVETVRYAHLQHTLRPAASAAEADAAQRLLREGVPPNGASPSGFPKLLKLVPGSALHPIPATAPAGDKAADLELGPYYFLTGFTIAHDYEWGWGATVTIDWCVVGCSATYGVQLNAGFNYAFGLRFPIQAQFKYHTVVHPGKPAEARLSSSFAPIEGNIDDFFQAGLAAEEMYDAKEIVAQVGADAGFSISLPGLGVGDSFRTGVDFTDKLPGPYAGGRFQPPAPGSGGINTDTTLHDFDLLGGLLNYGVVGGQLLPSIRVNLHSDKLQFTLYDEVQRRQTALVSPPGPVSLGVTPSGAAVLSHFSIGNPVYNLGFTVTPGLTPNVFVDIDVWSDNWNWTIWFPQLAVDLPPHGVDFGCHAGTTCVVDFEPVFNPGTGQIGDTSKERDAADRTLRGGGCQRVNGQEGNYLCPVKGMLGLCRTMLSNNAVSGCGALVPAVVDQILRRGKCTGNAGNDAEYACPQSMLGLCDLYVKNQEIVSCKVAK